MTDDTNKRTHDYCVHMNADMAETYGGVKRSDLPDTAFVFPDERTFPVKTAQDVKDAASSWGRYKGKHSREDFIKRLKARAKSIGASDSLPNTADWSDQGAPVEYMRFNVDLGQLVNGKQFDAMASGSFIDMRGRPVVITPANLQAYVENTNRVIESTKTESGEVVGLPIDMNLHDHKGGAGWITGASLDSDRNIVMFSVKWTDQGAQAIRDGLVRYFSPSLDPQALVVEGGSLINYPATKSKDGSFLLRPIELSSMLYVEEVDEKHFSINDVMQWIFNLGSRSTTSKGGADDNSNLEGVKDMPATIAELSKTPEGQAELAAYVNTKARELAQQQLAAEQKKLHLAQLASKWTGGTDKVQLGLPVNQDELVKFMTSLDEDQQKEAERILGGIWNSGLVDFKSRGHNGHNQDEKKKLPDEYAAMLDSGDMTLEDLTKPQLNLGEISQYDLSKWDKSLTGSIDPQLLGVALAAAMKALETGGAK